MIRSALGFRILHVLFGLYLFFILGYVYACGIADRRDWLLFVSVGSLLLEGVVLLVWRGRCPITLLQERHGDDRGFFGLFLPRALWPYVIPFFAAVAGVGLLLVAWRCL